MPCTRCTKALYDRKRWLFRRYNRHLHQRDLADLTVVESISDSVSRHFYDRRTGLASREDAGPVFCLAEDEADGFEELDGEEVDDNEGCAAGDAVAEGVEDVGQAAQTARYKAEGDGDEAGAKGNDRHEATAEGRREEVARGGKEDGVGRQREQGQDDEVDDKEDEGDAEGKAISKGERVRR